jgi:ribosomal protein L2
MQKLIVLIFLLISSVVFGGNGVEDTITKYSKSKQGEENWRELTFHKKGNLHKLTYNDEKQKNETFMIINDFWYDPEENATKMRVRFSAFSKDRYLLKLYKTGNGGYATLEKIEGNMLYPYFRRLDEYRMFVKK